MNLAPHLARLESEQLLRALADVEPAYAFKHVLTQETAYESLLRKRRVEIHRHVAEALERFYPDRLDEQAEALARHYAEAGDEAATLAYEERAGNAAARVYAHAEAIAHYDHALKAAMRAAVAGALTPEATARLHRLFAARGRAFGWAGRYDAALANYEEMTAAGRQLGDRSLELAGLIEQTAIRSTPNPMRDLAGGQALAEEALTLGRQLGDEAAEAKILWTLLLLHAFGGRPREGIPHGERSLELARKLNLREQMALTLNGLFMAYWPLGEIAKAQAALDEARPLWRELDNLPLLVENLARAFLLRFMAGDYDAALAVAGEGIRISRAIGDSRGQANCQAMLGHIYLDRGEIGAGLAVMAEAIAAGEQSGNPAPQIATRADLAWAYGFLGQPEAGLPLARLAQERAAALFPLMRPWATAALARLHLMAGDLPQAAAAVAEARGELKREGSFHTPVWVMLADAELALAQGEPSRAVAAADELLAYLDKVQTRPFRADAHCLKARALLAVENVDAASDSLAAGRVEAERLGARRILGQILGLQAELLARQDKSAEAAVARDQARAHVSFMAEKIKDPGLRASFLARANSPGG